MDSMGSSLPLVVTSVVLLHVSIQDFSPQPWMEWTELAATCLLVSLSGWFLRTRISRFSANAGARLRILGGSEVRSQAASPPTHRSLPVFACLLALGVVPFVTDCVWRQLLAYGNPLEIQFTLAIRNLMLGWMAFPGGKPRLAAFTSLFLAIYGSLVAASTTTNGLLGVYALFGLWWLMGDYWQRIRVHFPEESKIEIPYFARAGAVVLVLFALAVGALTFPSKVVTSAIAGMLPSSGGTGGSDPFARGGVGDGEQMVGATEDAQSFGPIESELFLESRQPTLYDMFIETYDEPTIKKREGRARAIPLSSQENQKQNHKNFAQNKKASREFSAIRRQSPNRQRPRKLDDLKSRAVLYVAGRTPLHLGMAYFDHWDGRTLSLQGSQPEPSLHLEMDTAQRKWATWDCEPHREPFADAERHQLKVINLRSATIPTPPNMRATHIDKLHDAGFFRWEDGLLRLLSDNIPSLTVLHVKSHRLRRRQLDALVLRKSPLTSFALPNGNESKLRELASDLTAQATSDWQRVELVCDHLHSFQHEPRQVVPEDTTDAVEHFLFESQRGPDYLFATSAAVLLRTLGYQTRVVSGLYADAKNYDRMARATGVYANNVHFWVEVLTANGHWVVVEPTPGFQVLYAPPSILESITSIAAWAVGGVFARPVTSLAVVMVVVGSFVCRRRLSAWAATWWWRRQLNASPRQQILHSVWLLQRLSRIRRSSRPRGQTLDQWIAARSQPFIDASSRTEAALMADFRALVSWACYASSDRPTRAQTSVRQICLDAVSLLRERV